MRSIVWCLSANVYVCVCVWAQSICERKADFSEIFKCNEAVMYEEICTPDNFVRHFDLRLFLLFVSSSSSSFSSTTFWSEAIKEQKKNTLPCIALHDMLHSHIHNSFAFRKEIFRVAFHFEFLFFVFVFCSITVSIITANMSIYDDHKIMNHSSIYRRINAKFLGWTMDLIGWLANHWTEYTIDAFHSWRSYWLAVPVRANGTSHGMMIKARRIWLRKATISSYA